jgi:hypothetical protein
VKLKVRKSVTRIELRYLGPSGPAVIGGHGLAPSKVLHVDLTGVGVELALEFQCPSAQAALEHRRHATSDATAIAETQERSAGGLAPCLLAQEVRPGFIAE